MRMKKIFLLMTVAMLCLLCSCRTGTTIHGQSCYELTESDKAMLTELARTSLQKSNRLVLASEMGKIMSEEPEFRIYYTGDKSGEARLTWTYSKKKVSIVFMGEFLTKGVGWQAEVTPIYDDVIVNRPSVKK